MAASWISSIRRQRQEKERLGIQFKKQISAEARPHGSHKAVAHTGYWYLREIVWKVLKFLNLCKCSLSFNKLFKDTGTLTQNT